MNLSCGNILVISSMSQWVLCYLILILSSIVAEIARDHICNVYILIILYILISVGTI